MAIGRNRQWDNLKKAGYMATVDVARYLGMEPDHVRSGNDYKRFVRGLSDAGIEFIELKSGKISHFMWRIESIDKLKNEKKTQVMISKIKTDMANRNPRPYKEPTSNKYGRGREVASPITATELRKMTDVQAFDADLHRLESRVDKLQDIGSEFGSLIGVYNRLQSVENEFPKIHGQFKTDQGRISDVERKLDALIKALGGM